MIADLAWATVACLLAYITARKATVYFILGFALNAFVLIPLVFTWGRAFRGHWRKELEIQEELRYLDTL